MLSVKTQKSTSLLKLVSTPTYRLSHETAIYTALLWECMKSLNSDTFNFPVYVTVPRHLGYMQFVLDVWVLQNMEDRLNISHLT